MAERIPELEPAPSDLTERDLDSAASLARATLNARVELRKEINS